MNLYWITFSTGVQEATGVGSGLCRNTHFLLASFVLFFFFFLSFCFFCIETPSLNLFCVHALNPEAMVLKPNQEWRLDPLILTWSHRLYPEQNELALTLTSEKRVRQPFEFLYWKVLLQVHDGVTESHLIWCPFRRLVLFLTIRVPTALIQE